MIGYDWRLACLTTFVLASPAALPAQGSQHEGSASIYDLAITRATLIDGTGGAPRPGTTVEVPAGATKINASGKYVIPGLADMRVHFSLGMPLPRLENETDIVLARKLYYGVTTIS